MKKTLFKDIKLRSGVILQKGLKVDVEPITGHNDICRITTNNESYRLFYTSVFKAPSIRTMNNWVMDIGNVTTPAGKITDPDGYDSEGYPSWLLVLGLI